MTREEIEEKLKGRHPATIQVCRHMAYGHLPAALANISGQICWLALDLVASLPDGPELTNGLRLLLSAKDSLVRAKLDAEVPA